MTDQRTIDRTGSQPNAGPQWLSRVSIRTAVKKDLARMEWGGEYARFRRIYAEVFERSQRGLAVMWVADLAEAGLIGQALVQLENAGKPDMADGVRRAYVHSFRVRPDYRNAGLGTRLMAAVEADLVARGFKEAVLNVTRENPGALRLYRRLGYRVIGSDPGRWTYLDEKGIRREVEEPGYRMLKRLR